MSAVDYGAAVYCEVFAAVSCVAALLSLMHMLQL